jgi:5-oxoprolinase (ATP-hydrolysing)/N-methylhydantoinase B
MKVEPGAEVTVNALLDRTKPGFGAWSLNGGKRGGRGAIMVRRAGSDKFETFSDAFGTVSDSKFTNVVLREGDEVLIDSPGGGGYGDPSERDRGLVEHDLLQGFVSPTAARDLYGRQGDA